MEGQATHVVEGVLNDVVHYGSYVEGASWVSGETEADVR